MNLKTIPAFLAVSGPDVQRDVPELDTALAVHAMTIALRAGLADGVPTNHQPPTND
jgi:hypothetical protein